MTTRLWTMFAVSLATVASVYPSYGGVIRALARDFAEVNNWPCPYVCWDREAATAPFPGMIENAWRRQNLLTGYHFTADNSLSPAGQQKVRWILTQAPVQHRTIYVRRGETAEETVARVNSIRQYAVKALPDTPPPNVLETYVSPAGYPAGWPGAKDDAMLRKFQPSVPGNLYLPDRGTGSSGQ